MVKLILKWNSWTNTFYWKSHIIPTHAHAQSVRETKIEENTPWWDLKVAAPVYVGLTNHTSNSKKFWALENLQTIREVKIFKIGKSSIGLQSFLAPKSNLIFLPFKAALMLLICLYIAIKRAKLWVKAWFVMINLPNH